MRYVKVMIGFILVLFGIVFILENRVVLEHSVQLRFDIYLMSLQTAHIPLWVLVLFSYFLGVFTAFLYFIIDFVKQRQTIRHLKHNLEILGQEMKRAGLVTEESVEPAPAAAPPAD
jgi:uncharacterized integral membrane protein